MAKSCATGKAQSKKAPATATSAKATSTEGKANANAQNVESKQTGTARGCKPRA
ncbi:MAG: hypothetical protein FWE38_01635 [Firmicutes bacterium]|nr:hypothetical protein [Bacillota bacterium]